MPLDTALLAETPEGIALALRAAGPAPRVVAYAIDWLARTVAFAIAATLLGEVKGIGPGLLLVLYFLLEWLYPVAWELLPGAATPGKRVMGLQVVMDDGLPVTPAGSVVRNLLRAADLLPFAYAAGLVSMLLRHDFKRIGDLVGGTLVVHAGHGRRPGALPPAAPHAPRAPLTRAGQLAILHLAGRAPRLTPGRIDELALLAAPVLPPADVVAAGEPAPAAPSPGARLLGVAQWLAGERAGGPPPASGAPGVPARSTAP